jgi:virginiamycin B lyase
MRFAGRIFVSLATTVSLASLASAATITGNVKGPDGKPFMGAFVIAENPQTRISVDVLSDAEGHYHINNLPEASYALRIRAIGYASDPREKVTLVGDQKASFDFALQTAPVAWSDLTTYQGRQLLPHTAEHDLSHKDPFFATCWQSCHSFQNKMARQTLDTDGARARVQYMRDAMHVRVGDDKADDFASLIALMFGPNSSKAASADQMPQYKSLVRSFSPEAMNIAYVEYDFPAPSGIGPWSAVEDKDGMMWIPYYGRGNAIVRLDPTTGAMKDFPLPISATSAGVHSAFPGPDGNIWFSELDRGRIGSLDPKTGQITEFQDTPTEDGKKTTAHTVRMDAQGKVWASGGPAISWLDPKTGELKHYDVGGTYGLVVAPNGDVWFTSFVLDGPIARVSKDGVLSKFYPPTKGKPQRLALDKDGNVWFTERQGNKLGRFDPKTESFKEFPLPGAEASPYAIGIDRDGMIWYSSQEQDTLGRFDPNTETVTEYPFPQSEISMREFFMDSKGRMWFASSDNNKVGYFYYNN